MTDKDVQKFAEGFSLAGDTERIAKWGEIHGLTKSPDETDAEFKQRILDSIASTGGVDHPEPKIKPGDTYMIGLDRTALGPRLAEFSGKIVEIATVFESKGKACASFTHRHLGVGAAFITGGLFIPVTSDDIARLEKRTSSILEVLEDTPDPIQGAEALAAAGFVKPMSRVDADQAIQNGITQLSDRDRRVILDALGW